ncbi:MAG: MFS transporter [Pyrinomonadaceae bacterium]|nr:MFS transporter [Pyrinomonadaceae bacterium]
MTSLTYMQLLRGNRAFRRLWWGQVISELGNWFNFIAGLGLVRAVSGGDPSVTAAVLMLRLAPFALFAPLAGACVDRWSRRTVMLVTDAGRAVLACGFLLVRGPEDLWIAYVCTFAMTMLTAFFEAAKNAALPNIAGERGLLAGNALMFSSRFLLMSIGVALGGAASARFGYEVAFVINAVSFVASYISIWLIPEGEMRAAGATAVESDAQQMSGSVWFRLWADIREGWSYIWQHRLVSALIGVNILWATGGGAIYLVYDQLGANYFAAREGYAPDMAAAAFYVASGVGLVVAMACARRIGDYVAARGWTVALIGWGIIAHGVTFALVGFMPTLVLACVVTFISRLFIGVEFAVQDTLLMRALPDRVRGRVLITDRAAEMSVMGLGAQAFGWTLEWITPQGLAIISGLLSASPGVLWLLLFATGKLRLPVKEEAPPMTTTEEAELAAAR